VQFGLLRRFLPRMGWWVPATAGGWLLGMSLVAAFIRLLWMVRAEMGLTLIVMGLSIGFTQWLVLRHRLPRAGWWIPASLLGWGLVALVSRGNNIDQYGLLVLGFLPGCATAAVLALLTKQADPDERQDASISQDL
jgi:peptidoglycan/LPS O-acetylase OafA/YrhL